MPETALLVADIHLSENAPVRTQQFFDFLQTRHCSPEPLFLLGDIFDMWCGDEEDSELAHDTRAALRELTDSGTPVFIQRGNRDFLLGARFARATGCTLLPDAYRLQWHGTAYLLTHGDALMDDPDYYRRRAFRRALYTALAAVLPLHRKRQIAARLRAGSRGNTHQYSIDHSRCARALRRHRCRHLIHGHTHRAGETTWTDNGDTFTRYALPDWLGTGGADGGNGGGYLQLRAEQLVYKNHPAAD